MFSTTKLLILLSTISLNILAIFWKLNRSSVNYGAGTDIRHHCTCRYPSQLVTPVPVTNVTSCENCCAIVRLIYAPLGVNLWNHWRVSVALFAMLPGKMYNRQVAIATGDMSALLGQSHGIGVTNLMHFFAMLLGRKEMNWDQIKSNWTSALM